MSREPGTFDPVILFPEDQQGVLQGEELKVLSEIACANLVEIDQYTDEATTQTVIGSSWGEGDKTTVPHIEPTALAPAVPLVQDTLVKVLDHLDEPTRIVPLGSLVNKFWEHESGRNPARKTLLFITIWRSINEGVLDLGADCNLRLPKRSSD